MITEGDAAVEESMQAVHGWIKQHGGAIREAGGDDSADRFRPLIGTAALAILAPRRRLRPGAQDPLTELLNELAAGSQWRLHVVPPPRPDSSLSSFYRSGFDIETVDGSRYDAWAFLVNARLGLIAPKVNPIALLSA